MSDKAPIGVAFLGGGSGGHIYPALAIAHALEATHPDARAIFITGDRAADEHALADKTVLGRPAVRVPIGARPLSLKPVGLVRLLTSWGKAVRDSRVAMQSLKSQCDRVVALSTGGYVSAPAANAARAERVPLVLVSLDARIGKANRFVARRAQRRLIAQNDGPDGWEGIGPIVGPHAIAPASKAECRQLLGLDPNLQTLLVMGGSQGATSINALMALLAQTRGDLLRGWQVVHLAGDVHGAELAQAAYQPAGIPALTLDRLWPIGPAWGAADLAICRGGAGTVAEIHANTVPAIILPYPYHKDAHQAVNAQHLVRAGGVVVAFDQIEPRANLQSLVPLLSGVLGDATKRSAMAEALRALPRRDGSAACAQALVEVARAV